MNAVFVVIFFFFFLKLSCVLFVVAIRYLVQDMETIYCLR